MHDAGELSCPRCGAVLEDIELPDAEVTSADEEIRVGLECPGCGTGLELVVASADGAMGVDVWLEDRRDDEA